MNFEEISRYVKLEHELQRAKYLLNYLFYARMPGGMKVEEYIPKEYWDEIYKILNPNV